MVNIKIYKPYEDRNEIIERLEKEILPKNHAKDKSLLPYMIERAKLPESILIIAEDKSILGFQVYSKKYRKTHLLSTEPYELDLSKYWISDGIYVIKEARGKGISKEIRKAGINEIDFDAESIIVDYYLDKEKFPLFYKEIKKYEKTKKKTFLLEDYLHKIKKMRNEEIAKIFFIEGSKRAFKTIYEIGKEYGLSLNYKGIVYRDWPSFLFTLEKSK